MKNSKFIIAFAAIIATVLYGCASSGSGDSSQSDTTKKITDSSKIAVAVADTGKQTGDTLVSSWIKDHNYTTAALDTVLTTEAAELNKEEIRYNSFKDNLHSYVFTLSNVSPASSPGDAWLLHKAYDANNKVFFILVVLSPSKNPVYYKGLPCPSICGVETGNLRNGIVTNPAKSLLQPFTPDNNKFLSDQKTSLIYTISVAPQIVQQVLKDNAAFFQVFVGKTAIGQYPQNAFAMDFDKTGKPINVKVKLTSNEMCMYKGSPCNLEKL